MPIVPVLQPIQKGSVALVKVNNRRFIADAHDAPTSAKNAPYVLYTRCPVGSEPLYRRKTPKNLILSLDGTATVLRPRYGIGRGAQIGRFHNYRGLVHWARFLTQLVGAPKKRWTDLFDWNKEEIEESQRDEPED